MHSPITLDRTGSVEKTHREPQGGRSLCFGMDRQISRKNTKHEAQDFTQFMRWYVNQYYYLGQKCED
jgi:hypothetical protein